MRQTKLAIMLASIALLVVSAASLVSAKGWVQVGGNWYYQNADGDYVTETIQASGNSKFYLGEDGAMVTDYFLESYGNGDNAYYFGSNGAMVTNTWVAIDPSIVSDQGDYIPDAYWYYFQATGKAIKAGDSTSQGIKKTTIDGKRYAFNQSGQMLTGWINDTGNVINPDDNEYPYEEGLYYAGGDNDGVLHSGWLAYYEGGNGDFEDRDVLYFYFNPTNNKKLGNGVDNAAGDHYGSTANINDGYITKKINGRTYAFNVPNGVMLVKWEGYNATPSGRATENNPWYFSDETDGHRAQKGWVYTVPAYDIDADDYRDDEEDWFYFTNNGDMVKNQIKRVGGKYYAFARNGEMKTGLIVFANGYYQQSFDMDNTRGEELAKAGIYRNKNNRQIKLTSDQFKELALRENDTATMSTVSAKIHYFGSDGARRTGSNNIEFADDEFVFTSNNSGNYEGQKAKKYYSFGVQLKASPDIRYGLIPADTNNIRSSVNYRTESFEVLNTSGAKVKGANSAKKDADGNYWLINKATDLLVGVYTVQVRITVDGNNQIFQFKGDRRIDANTIKSNQWINFGTEDTSHKTCSIAAKGLDANYAVDLSRNMDYALNFYWDTVADKYNAPVADPYVGE